MNFEIVNPDFVDGGGFFEREPNNDNALHMLYLNDGNGNSSAQSGFFLYFKQGTLAQTVFNIASPVENAVLPISATNVNNSDVWVQNVSDSGTVLYSWNKVPAIFSENITYSNYAPNIRNIFSVITQDLDAISIRFSDGRFGSIPVGNLKVWYRTSNGLQYQIRPTDMSRVKLKIPYYNRAGVKKNLTLTFSLQQSVSNSTPRETDAQIKARAPSVYATQNRMVSGEDYNTFPLQSNLALKIKAINRVYSGHSRYIDLNDPTGNYQDIDIYSDDGIFFKENYNLYTEVPISLNTTPSDFVSLFIQPMLNRKEIFNFSTDYLLTQQQANNAVVWLRSSSDTTFTTTGYFSNTNVYLADGANVLFTKSDSTREWATISSIIGDPTIAPPNGTAGPVTLSIALANNSVVNSIVPAFDPSLDTTTMGNLANCIANNQSFTLFYDYSSASTASPWAISPVSPTGTMFQLMTVNYFSGGVWSMSAKGLRYVFESLSNVQWYNDGRRTTDPENGIAQSDVVKILKYNEDLNSYIANSNARTSRGLGRSYDLNVDRIYLNRDGTPNPKRTTVVLSDEKLTGYSDDPDTFLKISAQLAPVYTDTNIWEQYLFWQHDNTYGDIPFSNMVYAFESEADRVNTTVAQNTIAFQLASTHTLLNNTFWKQTSLTGAPSGWTLMRKGAYSYNLGRGPNIAGRWYPAGSAYFVPTTPEPISFQWKHYASTEHRIDPARTNINDLFVLTSEYDYLTRLWIQRGAIPADIPTPPTELDLRLAFQQYEDYRVFSDQIVWRPAKYKFLFGNGAADQLRAQFKVVKLPNSALSDGEVSSQVIRAINAYFDVSLWDFGETFYYTELAAYIHQQLANIVASVVLVPLFGDANFGDGFEVSCRSDELFISTAQVSDVLIISSNTSSNLRIR